VVIITVVGYDYVLTLSREIDAIWSRPWTWVSTLFVIIRYVGLCWAVYVFVAGSIFVSGPVQVSIGIFVVGDWSFFVFLAAADLVMILRVNAMWNRSKTVFGILFFIYVVQMIVAIVWEIVYNNPATSLVVSTDQVVNFKFCGYTPKFDEPKPTYRAIPRFVLGAALLILAVIPTLAQSVEMYKITGRWRTNRIMQLLVREGAAYFIVNLLFNITNAIELPIVDFMLLLDTLSYSLCCVMMPRFVISIRELYDRDLRERWQGIDTGFGRRTGQITTTSDNMSTTALADVILGGRRVEDSETVELEQFGNKKVPCKV
ncbi:hypothetical protein EV363DRAFT_1182894, partial [Boletus edulis]